MFCDDTLVLDLSDPERILCLPGHKRLKLRPDAIALTGASPQEKVSTTVDKHYALPAAGDVHDPLPLAELIFLREAFDFAIEPIVGSERLVLLQDDHQTADLFAGARKFDRIHQFAHLARLARQIPMARFARPIDRARFEEGVALVVEHVTKPGP
jgi:hypothetical protein